MRSGFLTKHEQVILYLRPILGSGMYRQIVAPFVVAFWKARFTQRRIYFRNPSEVEIRLNKALASRDGDVVQQVIQAVKPGLT